MQVVTFYLQVNSELHTHTDTHSQAYTHSLTLRNILSCYKSQFYQVFKHVNTHTHTLQSSANSANAYHKKYIKLAVINVHRIIVNINNFDNFNTNILGKFNKQHSSDISRKRVSFTKLFSLKTYLIESLLHTIALFSFKKKSSRRHKIYCAYIF